jgi:hypothetical protein
VEVFVVADRSDGSVDGAQETDGLAVTSTSLGPNFPQGLIVVQDGFNTLPRGMQNFKIYFLAGAGRGIDALTEVVDCNNSKLKSYRHLKSTAGNG